MYITFLYIILVNRIFFPLLLETILHSIFIPFTLFSCTKDDGRGEGVGDSRTGNLHNRGHNK